MTIFDYYINDLINDLIDFLHFSQHDCLESELLGHSIQIDSLLCTFCLVLFVLESSVWNDYNIVACLNRELWAAVVSRHALIGTAAVSRTT